MISDCGDFDAAAASAAAAAASGEMKLPQNVCHFYSLLLHFLWPLTGTCVGGFVCS